jgi:PAS domain S-box-containing protein
MDRRKISRGSVAGLVLAVVLISPALLAYQLWSSYRDRIAAAEILTRNLAAIFEARFDVTLRRVDADLASFVEEIPVAAWQPGANASYAKQIEAKLDRHMRKAPEMAGYRLHDANGKLLYSSERANTPAIDISDRPSFWTARDDPGAGLIFSDPIDSPVNGRRSLALVRAMRDENGRFLGVVRGVIDLDYYRKQFESLSLGKNSLVALRRSDNHDLILRWPAQPRDFAAALPPDHPIAKVMASSPPTQTLHFDNRSDSPSRIVSFKRMSDYPFYFAVGLGRAEVLSDWYSRVWILGASTLTLFAFLAYMGLRLRRMRLRELGVLRSLRRSEAQYRRLAETVTVAICHLDRAGRCTYVNDRQLALTARSREDLIGRTWSDVVHPDDVEDLKMAWATRDRSAAVFVCEWRLLSSNGQITHVLGEVETLLDSHGHFRGAVIAQTDIGMRKQAEAELLAAKQQAETANIAKTRFLAAASHDLRQPIQAISLFRDALTRTDLDDEQRTITNLLSSSIRSLNDLLYSLLDISKLEAGQIKPQMSDVRVEDLFAAIATESSTEARRRGLRFKLYYPFKSLRVHTDSGLLLSVLRNLTDNALKYTVSGGVLVAARRRAGRVIIQIWDTGIGIADEDGERVFDDGFQIANPARDRSKGLGLGLSIARRLARLLEGDVSFRSRVGRGTVFEIDLPLATDAELADAASPAPGAGSALQAEYEGLPALRGWRVVVVEDDERVAKALEISLRRFDFDVRAYANGEDLLAQPDAPDADFYISDFRLPGINGLELLAALQRRLTQPLRAVLITGDTSPERIKLTASSPWPVLYKPMDLESLLAVMNASVDPVRAF